ncbi:hypothetical protein B296_00043380 [Ensete ventricosum]|uniref:Uncharacterized protein n=1 Tax=Ensete ventricosum TaxID=4639 RepID=A0A426XKW3_ENSVE|nr:hypothetical protein B296_00043380 [Ensete ventricosum]
MYGSTWFGSTQGTRSTWTGMLYFRGFRLSSSDRIGPVDRWGTEPSRRSDRGTWLRNPRTGAPHALLPTYGRHASDGTTSENYARRVRLPTSFNGRTKAQGGDEIHTRGMGDRVPPTVFPSSSHYEGK